MRVAWAIPCRYAEVNQGGTTLVGAGADVVLLPGVPAAVPVLFAVRFVGAPEELDGEQVHPFACRVSDPDGGESGEQTGQVSGDFTQVVPGYVAEVTVPIGITIDARRFGTYAVEFQIDDHALQVPVHVVQAGAE